MDASDKTQLDNNTGEWVREGLSVADADTFAAKLIPSWEIPESVQASSVVLNFSDVAKTPAEKAATPSISAPLANEAQLEQIIQSSQVSAVKEPVETRIETQAAPQPQPSPTPTSASTANIDAEPHASPSEQAHAIQSNVPMTSALERASAQPTQKIKHNTIDDVLVFPTRKSSSTLIWIVTGVCVVGALGYWMYASQTIKETALDAPATTATKAEGETTAPDTQQAPTSSPKTQATPDTHPQEPAQKAPERVTINLNVLPKTAKVSVNDKPLKKRTLVVAKGSSIDVWISAPGFADEHRTITATNNTNLTIELAPLAKPAAKKSVAATKVKAKVKRVVERRPVTKPKEPPPAKKPKGVGFVTDNPY